ncbi:MAG: hypothetical protein KAT77_04995 [Nanoarchaeota archaeon]|nr:hypothetical protein [Nanoarchaeota archaeon]
MDRILEKQKKGLGLLIFLVLISFLIFTQGDLTGFFAASSITAQTQLQWSNGSVAEMHFDNFSTTYGDPSLANGNMYLKVCSTNTNQDLLNNYTKLVYKMQNFVIDLTVMPAQMTAATISGSCSVVDIDLSTFAAYYPGIVSVVIADDAAFTNPSYYDLNETTGFLAGNYTVQYQQDSGDLVINITEILDDQGRNITTSLPFMIFGVKNSTGHLIYVNQTTPFTEIRFPYSGDGNVTFTINNYDVPTAQNLDTPEICTNNIDDDFDGLVDCADPECVNHPACLPEEAAPAAAAGGGGGASYCRQKWVCGEWLNCRPDGTQTRECIDINNCLNKSIIRKTKLVVSPKPDEIRSCDYIPQCDDEVINQDETDVDCGGEICAGCENGQHCLLDRDCLSYNCIREYCRPSGIQCYEDIDCPAGFTCEDFQCLFLKVFRKPDKLRLIEKWILWALLAVILTLSSYIAYEKYIKSPYKEKVKEEKYSKVLGDFIKQANLQGYSRKQIREALRKKGWPDKIINPYLRKGYRELPEKKPDKKATLKEEIKGYEEELRKLK